MRILLFVSVLLFAACSTTDGKYSSKTYGSEAAPSVYTVKKGDTLFAISWRYGLDPKVVMKRNGIYNANKIYVGQKLYLKSSATASSSASSSSYKKTSSGKRVASSSKKTTSSSYSVKKYGNWVWPMKGTLLKRFNPGAVGANGIRIAGKPNQTINAADGGTVAYKGNGLNGYGNLIIIKHNNGLLSAYGFLSKTYVKEGQKIKKRQKIGTVGYAANNKLALHFEVRKNGKPVNPLNYIGSSYHF